jgi:dTDP-glucose 4,6-dehydratase
MTVGEGSRVLVTGGAGFMPSHLVDRLIGRSAQVVAVVPVATLVRACS